MGHDWVEDAKRRAAVEAVKNIRDNFIIGLGSGSTAAYAIEEIGRRIREEGLRVLGIPTSYQSLLLAAKFGVPTTTLYEHPIVDLTIDGADQIDSNLNLIKGGGGALTREKIIAAASKCLIIVADERKLTDRLGRGQLLPVEVLPFAKPFVEAKIREIGGKPHLREDRRSVPFITENGNFILDVDFGVIDEPLDLERRLKMIPGVVETGLFIGMTHLAYIGTKTSVRVMSTLRE
ncbi:MAG: ribose 5-phosphate isomerase A [Candidatus Bathyarchaeia archaeon]|nr:ribose 5-phosphate isomerase A [Candidatus Bathyarchaeota archaeon]